MTQITNKELLFLGISALMITLFGYGGLFDRFGNISPSTTGASVTTVSANIHMFIIVLILVGLVIAGFLIASKNK